MLGHSAGFLQAAPDTVTKVPGLAPVLIYFFYQTPSSKKTGPGQAPGLFCYGANGSGRRPLDSYW